MSLPKKILAVLIGLPIAFFGTAFVHGMYLSATGQSRTKDSEPAKEQPVSVEAPATAPATETPASATGADELAVPAALTAQSATAWLQNSGFFFMKGEEVSCDLAQLAKLSVVDAHRLYTALRAGGKKYESMRYYFFAWMGEFERKKLTEFADLAGAVDRPSDVSMFDAYTGDFTGLFYFQKQDTQSIYARAVRNYAGVLESNAILDSLENFGAIDMDPTLDGWRIRVDQQMKQFDPDTLLALRDGIDKALYGDRNYLRDQLEDFAKSQRDTLASQKD